MPPIPYQKPALTFQQQLTQLKQRGLVVEDDSKALALLESISYYRLSGYWYPFLEAPKNTHIFKSNSSFNEAFSLYCFDRELRKMLYGELEKIEVAIRAKMIYTLSHLYGAFWYTNVNLFSNNNKHANTLASLNKEYTRSNEDFLLAFRANYTDPMPPSWMMLEASSFGNLSNLYSNLRPGKAKRSIANHFGLDETTFASWIHSIGYIRNMCAHHSRLWNKKLSIPAAIPTTPANDFLIVTQNINSITNAIELVNNKTYYILSMMIYLLNIINPKNKFKKNFFLLLKKYPHADIGAMGFTSSWKDELIWKINKQPLNEIISDLMKKVKNHLSSFFFP